VEKTYWAVIEGQPRVGEGTISNYLIENRKSLKVFASDIEAVEARRAISHFRVLKTRGDLSLMEVRLETGRKHQIRVHLAGLGCPVVGDARYGATSDACGRLGLHACRLELSHPVTRERLSFCSPLPRALGRLFC
jgi:23S rRNA pseudouridine1911/1915/1917 synthase